jgi:hypothetical protein
MARLMMGDPILLFENDDFPVGVFFGKVVSSSQPYNAASNNNNVNGFHAPVPYISRRLNGFRL